MEDKRIPLLVVCGPTASGKTKLAVDLARRFHGEVVSADSMQIYRHMDIGTAKPSQEEMAGIPHHLLDIAEPDKEFSLVCWLELARRAISGITARGALPVLAGGTGLYIHSLVDNIQFADIRSDPVLRENLEREARKRGARHMWDRLNACDPLLAAKLHPNNLGRIIRALEVYELTGETMSALQARSRAEPSPYAPCMLGLGFRDRERLYERIDRRVDLMLEQGLEAEARNLYGHNLSKTAVQAIGYKELFAYFAGETTREEAVELIKLRSRRYAKRQLTWLRGDTRIRWLYNEDYAEGLHAEAERLAGQVLNR